MKALARTRPCEEWTWPAPQGSNRVVVVQLTHTPKAGIISAATTLDCNEIGDTQLEVRYEDKKLEKLCTDEREMRRRRSDIADKLRRRIKALETAKSVGELPIHDPLGKWHPLKANLSGLWSGKLSANYRLLIRPADAAEPQNAVTVTVIDIDDYH